MSVGRREFLRLAGGAALGARLAPQDTAGADPLFRPDMVQQRPNATTADNDPIVTEIERRLKCMCGCNLDIYTCRTTDFTCTYSPELHKELLALKAGGAGPEAIVTAFVAKYGEQILMAPKPEGFNLAGYLVPGAVVTLVGAALAWVLLRRAGRARRDAALAEAEAAKAPKAQALRVGSPDAAELERLREALAEVED
ncbi:MAG: hypothetical protein HOP28_05555 [Gemmatimonadales bacterium]|nr:hypothetical protein [Gemmatimonadales bacterium]